MIEVYLEPVNVFYFGASTFQKRPFPIKTVVIWVPGICIYKKIQSKIKYTRYGQNLWFTKRSLAKLVSQWVPYGILVVLHGFLIIHMAYCSLYLSVPPWFLHGKIWCLLRHFGWSLVDCLYECNFLTGTRYTLDVTPIMFVGCIHYVTSTWFTNLKRENFQQNHDPFCCLRRLPLRLGNISLESWKSGSQTLNVWHVFAYIYHRNWPNPGKYTSAIEYLGMDWRCKTFSQMRVSSVWKDTSIWRVPFWKDSDEPSKVGLESKWSVLRSHP